MGNPPKEDRVIIEYGCDHDGRSFLLKIVQTEKALSIMRRMTASGTGDARKRGEVEKPLYWPAA